MKVFETQDTDGNGTISRKELMNGYIKLNPSCTVDKIEKIVSDIFIQVNFKKEINFTDFCVAAMNKNFLTKDKIKQIFNLFDTDGNGYIDKSELKFTFQELKLSDNEFDNLIKEVDIDGDGRISASEFEVLMQKF